MNWISTKDRLPVDGQYVLCTGNHENDNEFENEILDSFLSKELDEDSLNESFNPVLSVEYRNIEGVNHWLYPNIDGGGLIDFGDSITHWMELPDPPIKII